MSLAGHLKELEKKHKDLEDQIATAMKHPGSSDLDIQHLKREKLHIKEEIAKVTAQMAAQ